MKWKNDEYRKEKEEILYIITEGISKEHAKNVPMRLAFDAIDELFEKLKNSKKQLADN